MLGAIIGDIIGSYYEVVETQYFKKEHTPRPYEERMKIMDLSTELFTKNCSCTDDSILTCAIADAILNKNENIYDYEKNLKEYGLREIDLGMDIYGRSRFGKGFVDWLQGNYQGTSYGNGAAMRISAIGFCFDTLEEVRSQVYLATIPSHNHEESLLGAEAVAVSIYLLRNGMTKQDLKQYIEKKYYSLNYNLETLRREYTVSSNTNKSVPQALFVFLESNNFEDAIRKAISIGGDSDTIAAIVGGLSEAYYGLDEKLVEKAKPYIKDYMWPVIRQFYERKQVKCKKK